MDNADLALMDRARRAPELGVASEEALAGCSARLRLDGRFFASGGKRIRLHGV